MEKRSSWVRVGLNPRTGVLMRRAETQTQRRRPWGDAGSGSEPGVSRGFAGRERGTERMGWGGLVCRQGLLSRSSGVERGVQNPAARVGVRCSL